MLHGRVHRPLMVASIILLTLISLCLVEPRGAAAVAVLRAVAVASGASASASARARVFWPNNLENQNLNWMAVPQPRAGTECVCE